MGFETELRVAMFLLPEVKKMAPVGRWKPVLLVLEECWLLSEGQPPVIRVELDLDAFRTDQWACPFRGKMKCPLDLIGG